MIMAEHGRVFICSDGLILDIISIMGAINDAVATGEISEEDLYNIFSASPETVTTFTKNFVKATHK